MADGYSPRPDLFPRLSSRRSSVSSTPRGSTPSFDCVPETPPKLWPGHSTTSSQSCSHSSTPSRLTGEESTEDATDSFLIVDIGVPFDFRIPSFPVVVVTLRRICFEVEGENEDDVIKYDGFIKDEPSLDGRCPGIVLVTEWCFVDVDEFFQGNVYAYHLKTPRPREVYVAWKWTWIDRSLSPPPCPSIPTSPQDSPRHSPNNDETEVGTDTYHVVKFKCIGARKDEDGQMVLKALAQLEKGELDKIEVKMVPEPDNPVDAKAIAFVTFWDGRWQRIGYVVSEALDDVHLAMNNKQIINVCFDWVKFRINWIRSGFGYYAAINVTKRGKWSPTVCRSASTI